MSRKAHSYLGVFLMVVGVAFVVHYGYGVVYSHFHQDRLMREAQASWENPVVVMEDRPIKPPRPSAEEPEEPEEPEDEVLPADDGPFIIIIPKLEIEAVVLEGVDLDTLAQGPGFYPDNPRPGREGNVAVAGHRTTYGAWFRNVDRLEEGDEIIFSSPVAEYRYLVEQVYPVASNAWEVVDPTEEPKLTLTTCHPPGSARQRLVVRAALDDVEME